MLRRGDRDEKAKAAPRGSSSPSRLNSSERVIAARRQFEKRAAAARRRPKLVAALIALVVLLGGLLVWLGWFSSVLAVTTVKVEGVPAAEAKRISAVAQVPMGVPLMRVDTDAIKERVEKDLALKDVSVSRDLPHTISISGTPRVGVLAVKNSQGQVEVVDADGVAFSVVTTPPKGLPLASSGSAEVTPSGRRAALAALAALDPTLRTSVTGIALGSADGVTLTLKVGGTTRTVVWGSLGEESTKAKLVKALLKEPGSTIDVSVPSSPVMR